MKKSSLAWGPKVLIANGMSRCTMAAPSSTFTSNNKAWVGFSRDTMSSHSWSEMLISICSSASCSAVSKSSYSSCLIITNKTSSAYISIWPMKSFPSVSTFFIRQVSRSDLLSRRNFHLILRVENYCSCCWRMFPCYNLCFVQQCRVLERGLHPT